MTLLERINGPEDLKDLTLAECAIASPRGCDVQIANARSAMHRLRAPASRHDEPAHLRDGLGEACCARVVRVLSYEAVP